MGYKKMNHSNWANSQMDNKIIKNKKKVIKSIFIILFIVLVLAIVYLAYIEYRPKFKNLTIELGTNMVSIEDFLVSNMYEADAKILTDLSEIDFTKVSEVDIKLSYKGKEEIVRLRIVDTKAPIVEFQDISKYIGYKVNAEDFIVYKKDLSEMTINVTQIDDTNEFKDYVVKVTVKDIYGNETTKDCILTITWLKPTVYVELGSSFSKGTVLLNIGKDADKISQSEIEKVNTMVPGEYIINSTYDNKNYTSKVIVKDTTPPELELKDLTIYDNNKVTKDNFIKNVKDISGEVTTTLKTDIDYTKSGEQKITIEASDKYGNKTEKTTTLTIMIDNKGPVFSGLGSLSVSKNSKIDYNRGVKAVDANEGNCNFTVDKSKVNTSVAGTYYATYTSKDSKGNKTTAKRKIVVNHDQADTDQKFNTFYNQYLTGKSILEMTSTIKSIIKYNTNWGGDDPVWYGLTNTAGNCYVHALMLQKALTKAGITNRLIHTIDKTHYWNLVYSGGIWRHYDSTPGLHIVGPATDDEKFNSDAMKGRDWDRDAYPKAE
ncbi:MAG: immunoglobulin-like domain-containing protein [Bacilli bacterium]